MKLSKILLIAGTGMLFILSWQYLPVEILPEITKQMFIQAASLVMGFITAAADNLFIALCVLGLSLIHHGYCSRARIVEHETGKLNSAFISLMLFTGLGFLATEVKNLAPNFSGNAESIFSLYGPMALFYVSALSVVIREYCHAVKLIPNSEMGNSVEKKRPGISKFIKPGIAVMFIIGVSIYFLFNFNYSSIEEIVKLPKELPDKKDSNPEKLPELKKVNPTSIQIVEQITVDSSSSKVRSFNGDLPSNLRISWEQGANGWEPAFIYRNSNDRYEKFGKIVSAEEIKEAYAIEGEGPAIKPTRGTGHLFFHKDVLSRLVRLFNQEGDSLQPNVHIGKSANGVVMQIPGSEGNRSRLFTITMGNNG